MQQGMKGRLYAVYQLRFLRNPTITRLAFVLLLALLPRVYAIYRWAPYLRADSFEYLKLARILRGKKERDDWGWRTPGYPLFLNIVFALSRWRGTSKAILARVIQQQAEISPGSQIHPWHMHYLRTEENLRAVQMAQHGLGLLATGLLFQLLWGLTSNPTLAIIGALIAIGWNPYWFWFYESSVLTEVLAATLLMGFFFALQEKGGKGWTLQQLTIAALIGSITTLVRPQFVLTTPLLLAWWLLGVFRRQVAFSGRALAALILPFLTLVGGWIVRNGVRYRYWGLSTVAGFNLCMHFTGMKDFDAFPDPFLQEVLWEHSEKCPYPGCRKQWVILHAYPDLAARWRLPLPAIAKRLERQTFAAILRHPQVFLLSVLKALAAFFRLSPPGHFAFLGPLWIPFALPLTAGLLVVLLMPHLFSPFIRFVSVFVVVTALFTAITAGGASPIRYGFSTDPLLVLLSVVAAQQVWCRWKTA